MTIDLLGIRRFFKYSLVGSSTFALDLGLLFILIDGFKWHPTAAAGTSFIIAVSLNYLLSRRYVFPGSIRSTNSGFLTFLGIASGGLVLVTGLMAVFVGIFGWNFLFSRTLIAVITGFWNYLLNLYVNFKVAGQHKHNSNEKP